jgi:hypothetical protein
MRQQLVKFRTMQINSLRDMLTEYGGVMGTGRPTLDGPSRRLPAWALHDDQPAALLLTTGVSATTMAMVPRVMRCHANVVCNPDKPSLKIV